MPELTPQGFIEDVERTRDFSNSEDPTYLDRNGNPRRTIAGINAQFDAMQSGELTAQAVEAADRAETAAEVAISSGRIYTSAAEGVADTSDNDYFWVVAPSNQSLLQLWQRVSGSGVNTGKETTSFDFSVQNSLEYVKGGSRNTSMRRILRAIKLVELEGDYEDKILTLASFAYTPGNDVFSLIIAAPDDYQEEMSGSSNTKFIASVPSSYAPPAELGVHRIPLIAPSSLGASLGVKGFVEIDFNELESGDQLSSDYNASQRLIDKRLVHNLNGGYANVEQIKRGQNFVYGRPSDKLDRLNECIVDFVVYDDIPEDYELILSGLFYAEGDLTDGGNIRAQIYASNDGGSGSPVALGIAEANPSGVTRILLDGFNPSRILNLSGYLDVDLRLYYSDNIGAAVISDNATPDDRGVNVSLIRKGGHLSPLRATEITSFNDSTDFMKTKLLASTVRSSVSVYVQGALPSDELLSINQLAWSTPAGGGVRLNMQFRRTTEPDELLSNGVVVFSAQFNFASEDDVGGVRTVEASRSSGWGFPFPVFVEVDFSRLPFITSFNSLYFSNTTGQTWITNGLSAENINYLSARRNSSSNGGLPVYDTVFRAIAAQEDQIFAVGGNTFKSKVSVPAEKHDVLCTSNHPKVVTSRSIERRMDVYHLGDRVKLEWIDSQDNFYFVKDDALIKSPHPFKQERSHVQSPSDGDLVIHDLESDAYFHVAESTVAFTSSGLGFDRIKHIKLTHDDEILIIGETDGLDTISLTEGRQGSIKAISVDGGVANEVWSFGQGVKILKDWSMSSHGSVIFLADYATGNERGAYGGQKCYVSLDNGHSFNECFSFDGNWGNVTNAENITDFDQDAAHIHAVVYDPKQGVVWLITGDGGVYNDNSSFFWSRDLGATWRHVRTALDDTGGRTQMVNGIPFEGCIAMGSDAGNFHGVGVITYSGDNVIQEVGINFQPEATSLWSYSRNAWESLTGSGIKFMSFGKVQQARDEPGALSCVMSSSNGYQWNMVWEDGTPDVYGNVFCFDDSDGVLYTVLDGIGEVRGRLSASRLRHG